MYSFCLYVCTHVQPVNTAAVPQSPAATQSTLQLYPQSPAAMYPQSPAAMLFTRTSLLFPLTVTQALSQRSNVRRCEVYDSGEKLQYADRTKGFACFPFVWGEGRRSSVTKRVTFVTCSLCVRRLQTWRRCEVLYLHPIDVMHTQPVFFFFYSSSFLIFFVFFVSFFLFFSSSSSSFSLFSSSFILLFSFPFFFRRYNTEYFALLNTQFLSLRS